MDLDFYKPIIDVITANVTKGVLDGLKNSPALIVPALMKPAVAAAYMGITQRAILQRRQNGQIPADCMRKMGESVMFVKAGLDRWIDNLDE